MVREGHGSLDENLSEQDEDLTEKSTSVALLESVGKQAFYSEWDWEKGQTS